MAVRIGVDTGGTFTDVVLYDETTSEVHTTKTPSTPPSFDRGVLDGIDKILAETEIDPGTVAFLSHGTTIGTNAILEDEFPDIGLITNEGLRDVLAIGDQTRPELYNLQTDKPPALVPRYLRTEVPGRIDSQGEEVEPLDETRATEAITQLAAEDVDSIVVSMLFSYLNDTHERRIGELIEEHDLEYARSSAVYPETREYDRTVTTVLNEAVKTKITDYLDRLTAGVRERGIDVPLSVMHSGGGIFGTDQAATFALRTVLSGPAAGAVAAREVSAAEEYENAIGLDMGGTSADVSIVEGGELVRSTEGEIRDLPIKTPLIDINTVGAGGGSIAWLDRGGGLRVGPRSAGADPGPICYDRGGEEPTVTDANLVLGRIDPGRFLDGEMDLAVETTRRVFEETIADALDESIEEAALDVLRVANAKMAREIRRVTVERGRDPAGFALVAFGGAGPLQAPAIADHMDMGSLVVPRSPGVLSARGLLIADVQMDASQAYRGTGTGIDATTVREQFEELETDLLDRFHTQGFATEEVELDRALDVRYRGQSYELTVSLPEGIDDGDIVTSTVERFHETHARLYGHAMRDEPVEVVTLRITGSVPTPAIEDRVESIDERAYRGERDVYFEGVGYEPTAIYHRPALAVDDAIDGPAIVEEPGCTTLVPPGAFAKVTNTGSLIVTPTGGRD